MIITSYDNVFLRSVRVFLWCLTPFAAALKLCDICCDCQTVYTISLQLLKYVSVCVLFVILHIFYILSLALCPSVILSSGLSYHVTPLCRTHILFPLVKCLFAYQPLSKTLRKHKCHTPPGNIRNISKSEYICKNTVKTGNIAIQIELFLYESIFKM